MQAIASTLVDGPIRDLEEEYQMIAQMAADKQVDVILIWGTDDEIVDYQYALKMKKIIPSAELVSFQGSSLPAASHRDFHLTIELLQTRNMMLLSSMRKKYGKPLYDS